MRRAIWTLTALAALAAPAAAQHVGDCVGWQAGARNVAWSDDLSETMRSFANGEVQVVLLDTFEPASQAFHLLVTWLAPPEMHQDCRLVSAGPGAGFNALSLSRAVGRYDPTRGLTITVPGRSYGGDAITVTLTLNRATGTLTIP